MEVYGLPQPSWTIPSRDRSVGCGVRPRWPPKGGKRCAKADSPTSASLSKGCTTDLTVDESVAPKFERYTISAWALPPNGKALLKPQDDRLKRSPKFEPCNLHEIERERHQRSIGFTSSRFIQLQTAPCTAVQHCPKIPQPQDTPNASSVEPTSSESRSATISGALINTRASFVTDQQVQAFIRAKKGQAPCLQPSASH